MNAQTFRFGDSNNNNLCIISAVYGQDFPLGFFKRKEQVICFMTYLPSSVELGYLS